VFNNIAGHWFISHVQGMQKVNVTAGTHNFCSTSSVDIRKITRGHNCSAPENLNFEYPQYLPKYLTIKHD